MMSSFWQAQSRPYVGRRMPTSALEYFSQTFFSSGDKPEGREADLVSAAVLGLVEGGVCATEQR